MHGFRNAKPSLERRDWQKIRPYFALRNTHKVTIEVERWIRLQKEVENVALDGVSYDPKGGTIAIRAGQWNT
jgi:hypothetical protein